MTSHAACSPSSAAMWLACPASVTLTRDIPRTSSKYAREGTAAHRVAEMVLNGDIFLPDKIVVEGEEFIVSAGMCRTLNPYISYVQRLKKRRIYKLKKVVLEHRVQVPDTDGLVWGTMDCGAYSWRDLIVADLKYGKGHRVEPNTPQLKLYALGFAAEIGANEAWREVTLVIFQPRVGNDFMRTWTTTLGELWAWSDFVMRPALLKIMNGDITENAGPHCRWCVRRTECAAFQAQHQARAAEVFDDATDT
jgi:Protein of unknown function (DUF2800)